MRAWKKGLTPGYRFLPPSMAITDKCSQVHFFGGAHTHRDERAEGRAARFLPCAPFPSCSCRERLSQPWSHPTPLQRFSAARDHVLLCRWFPMKSGAAGLWVKSQTLALPNGFKASPSPWIASPLSLECSQALLFYVLSMQEALIQSWMCSKSSQTALIT